MTNFVALRSGLALPLLVTAFLAGCATGSPSQPTPHQQILAAALKVIDQPTSRVRFIVFDENLDAASREATRLLHPTLPAPPQTDELELPAGYLILREIRISGDNATVVATLGPIPKPRPGELLLNCGTGYEIPLHRRADGSWHSETMTLTVC